MFYKCCASLLFQLHDCLCIPPSPRFPHVNSPSSSCSTESLPYTNTEPSSFLLPRPEMCSQGAAIINPTHHPLRQRMPHVIAERRGLQSSVLMLSALRLQSLPHQGHPPQLSTTEDASNAPAAWMKTWARLLPVLVC